MPLLADRRPIFWGVVVGLVQATTPPQTDFANFSGTDAKIVDGDLDAGTPFPVQDDSADFLIEVEPICTPPQQERVDYEIDLHF